jgi:hypothetical protein
VSINWLFVYRPINQILICYEICETDEIAKRKKVRLAGSLEQEESPSPPTPPPRKRLMESPEKSKCPHCWRAFENKKFLKKHIRRKHKKELIRKSIPAIVDTGDVCK